MEFKELIEKRRSIRKFSERAVPREVVDRILHETLSAPSARNTRTTHLVVVDDPALVARMADMRDYGSAFMKGAPLAIVVLGDTTKSDLWRENAAISATILQLACVDEGLASCWVHINAVYNPDQKGARKEMASLIHDNRVSHVCPADYSEGSDMDILVKTIIDKIDLDDRLEKLEVVK